MADVQEADLRYGNNQYKRINHSSADSFHSSSNLDILALFDHKTIADINKSRTFAAELIKTLFQSVYNSIGY